MSKCSDITIYSSKRRVSITKVDVHLIAEEDIFHSKMSELCELYNEFVLFSLRSGISYQRLDVILTDICKDIEQCQYMTSKYILALIDERFERVDMEIYPKMRILRDYIKYYVRTYVSFL